MAALALLALASVPLFARNPPPKFSIPLDPLTIQPSDDRSISTQPFTTVNFVDNHHLLVSYTVHRLMKRLPDEPPDDDDRLVEAVLLEIPSGKVLASTEWRLHDRARYLWDLGHGHFMLRVRGTFTTIAPLANLDHGHAFDERPFLKVITRRVSLIQFSPEADFMVLETEPIPPPEPDPVHTSPMASFNAAISGSAQPQLHVRSSPPPDVQIMFYRLSPDAQDNARIIPRVAGGAVTRNLVSIPANSTSFISAIAQAHQAWAFDVNTYAGKVYQLPLFDSTCRPVSAFVSKAEFIVFGCRGGNDPRRVGAFNLRGEEMWEKSFFDTSLRPAFAFAPAAGRFAMGRLIVSSTLAGIRDISPGQISGETVDVYQTASGNQLLHLDCNPVEPGSQNFAISPDGMTFAIRNNGAIDFYVMPELTKKEQAAIQLAMSSAPEEIEVPVRLNSGHTAPADSSQAETTSPMPPPQTTPNQAPQPPDQQPIPQPPTAQASTDQPAGPQSVSSQSANSQPTSAADDPPTETHRKPPTLYNAPGEQPPDGRNTSQPK
jgi:hypothetical protein